MCDDLQHAGLLQTSDRHKQADKEQKGLIVHPAENPGNNLGSGRCRHRHHRQNRHDDTDTGNRQSRLRMRNQENNGKSENKNSAEKRRLAFNRRGRLRAGNLSHSRRLVGLQLLAEAEPEIYQCKKKADSDHRSGI